MKTFNSVLELIGGTPLLLASKFMDKFNISANIFAKLECFNPGGSIKDRTALNMIIEAETDGKLLPGGTIIEPTSGNTGIGLAYIGILRGYKVIITMPSTMSAERIKTMEAYGAKVVLTKGSLGMQGAIDEANKIAESTENSLVMGQFITPSNSAAHYKSTGPEIWDDLDGNVDILISAVGTGGTISGTAKYLKEKNKSIKIIAVEPKSSAVLSGCKAGSHRIQGIGAGFVPEILDLSLIDEIVTVDDEDAYYYGREFSKTEGVLVGISSGAALAAATKISKDNTEKNIVVILPDSGTRNIYTPNNK